MKAALVCIHFQVRSFNVIPNLLEQDSPPGREQSLPSAAVEDFFRTYIRPG